MNLPSKVEPQVIDIADVNKKGEFNARLAETNYGDKIVYSRGVTAGGMHKQDALNAWEAGYVGLVQKRIGVGRFDYIAQRTRKRLKKT
jgi:hypothetical protein